ncbi:hypothetical protein, partial [Candidatus Avelusimicrobium facis]|uniref:hypothetical protein n=1 Tax=Candidatus Avelusimicrobium facis TaxID=3416203 RepID=UPI003D09CEA8
MWYTYNRERRSRVVRACGLQHNDVYVVNRWREWRGQARHKQIFMEETNMKKIIATVLAMVMALALCTTAFAA